MADENRMITFAHARATWDQFKKQTIPDSLECMTKAEINTYLNADMNVLSAYSSNQLIPRSKFSGISTTTTTTSTTTTTTTTSTTTTTTANPNPPFTQAAFDGPVYDILIQGDNKILVGGAFTNPKRAAVRLNTNGSTDTAFLGTTTNSSGIVYAIEIDTNGDVWFGGSFTSFQGSTSYQNLVKVTSTGSVVTAFTNAFTNASTSDVRTLLRLNDRSLMVGGMFYRYNGQVTGPMICIKTDYSLYNADFAWTRKNDTIQTGYPIQCILSADNNRFIFYYSGDLLQRSVAGGPDAVYGNTASNGGISTDSFQAPMIMYRGSTGQISDGTVCDGAFYPASPFADRKIIVVGKFNIVSLSSNLVSHIMRLNPNGSRDTTFIQGTGFNSICYAVALQSDGKILVGGAFTSYNGTASNYIIRLNDNGTVDNTFNAGVGFDATVRVIRIQTNGKILVGGNFTSYNGNTANYIVRLNADGTIDN